MLKEIWKDVKDYEGFYQVSNLGKVRSLDRYTGCENGVRLVKGRILKQGLNLQGYPIVCLCVEDKRKTQRVHRLVATAFIQNDNHLPEVNHKDHDKTNNCVSNLEWCTRQYNVSYSDDKLKNKYRRKSGFSKAKKINQYDLEWNLLATYVGATSVEKLMNVPATTIRNRCIRGGQPFNGYYWRYADTQSEVKNAAI